MRFVGDQNPIRRFVPLAAAFIAAPGYWVRAEFWYRQGEISIREIARREGVGDVFANSDQCISEFLRRHDQVGKNRFRMDCEDWNEDTPNQVALARVVTTQTRLHFIAGRDKRRPACPSLGSACKLKAFLVPGDEVLVNVTEQGPYVCATFKTQNGILTRGLLPRAALQVASPEQAPAQQWEGKWRRDSEAEILIKSHGDEVEISGTATWGGRDPQRVKRGAINTGELTGSGKPRGQVLAIGYDPDRSVFPPSEHEAPDICAAQLELHGRYLMVEDNGRCGGLNVSFSGLYVRVAN